MYIELLVVVCFEGSGEKFERQIIFFRESMQFGADEWWRGRCAHIRWQGGSVESFVVICFEGSREKFVRQRLFHRERAVWGW